MISFIRPIHPNVIRVFEHADRTMFIEMAFIILLSVFAALCLANYSAKRFDGHRNKTIWLFIGITALAMAFLFCFFGVSAITVKGIILSLILTFCSYSDVKTRECDDYPFLMIVIAAFIGTELADLSWMVLSAVTAFTVLVIAIILNARVNGADLKLAVTCAFCLGINGGMAGLILGLLLGIICNTAKKNKGGFPLIPYLAVGYMAAYFI